MLLVGLLVAGGVGVSLFLLSHELRSLHSQAPANKLGLLFGGATTTSPGGPPGRGTPAHRRRALDRRRRRDAHTAQTAGIATPAAC